MTRRRSRPGTLLVLGPTPDDSPPRVALLDVLAQRALCSVLLVR